ncbi:MAG: hypothetical protein KIS87_14640 [Phycisphaeraceae bacterium]|nr:hypothetical protein [Phycisphaeraceae bacterium]
MIRNALVLSLAAGFAHPAVAQEVSTDDARAFEAELLADAATRASLLDSAKTAGHDGRFFVGSADGNFKLSIVGEVQFRYYAAFDAGTDAGDDFVGGFQLNRTRLDFRGHIIEPNLTYRILGNFNRETGVFELQDAYGEYKLESGLSIRWGQFKPPFDREHYASSPTQLQTVENSLVASIFRIDRSQGVQFTYEAERVRLTGAVSDGRRALNTAYFSDAEADFALTGRLEARLGEAPWRQYRDQIAFRGDKTGALVGLGGHWQRDGMTGAPSTAPGEPDLFSWTADIGYENDGWNLLGAVTGRVIDWSGDSYSDVGFVVQGGVFVTDHAELFARYAHVMPDDDRSGGSDDFPAITAGVNWYFIPNSHALKLSAEVTCYPEAQADSASIVRAPDSSTGLMPDNDGGQVGFVLQMQMIF